LLFYEVTAGESEGKTYISGQSSSEVLLTNCLHTKETRQKELGFSSHAILPEK
jgi:hypothetical protein